MGDVSDIEIPGGRSGPENGPAGQLRLFVLGPVQAEAESGSTIRLRSRKARAALAYLALTPRAEETRERLVGLLWSESEEEKARASLRQVVHELREAMDRAGLGSHLRTERLSVGLDAHRMAHDMGAVLAEAEAGRVHPRLLDTPRLPDTLLEGLDDLDPSFRVWLLARRQAFQDRLMQLLEPRLRVTDAAARTNRRAMAQALLRLDPTHEEACRAFMEAAAAEGDTAAALRAYEQLWTLLDSEYDMEPSAPTQALVAEIKSGRFEAPSAPRPEPPAPALPTGADAAPAAPAGGAAAPVPAAARVALLVEPFSINGVPPERAHLVHGFRHEMIACLVRFREWYVVDGRAMPPGRTDARVSVRYGITATAYQAGNRISMLLTLAEQESGIFVWSERVELSLENWFEAQQRILRRIAASFNAQLSTARLMRLAGEPDVSLEAYDRWLRGQAMIFSFSADPEERAVPLLQETVERMPGFAPAWSGLAQALNNRHIGRPGVPRDREREQTALGYARRAVELDPTDSRAHLAFAWAQALADRHAQGETNITLALDLNPFDSWTLMSAAMFHGFAGDHDRAHALAEQALETTLAPSRTHWVYHGTIAFLCGDFERAAESLQRAEEHISQTQAWRAAALAHLGRLQEAQDAAQRFLATCRERWRGKGPATDTAITAWMLVQCPIRRPSDWAQLATGLRRVGLPTTGAAHGNWYVDFT